MESSSVTNETEINDRLLTGREEERERERKREREGRHNK